MPKPEYTGRPPKFTKGRQRPQTRRRMACSACDQYATCHDTGEAWLCPSCEEDYRSAAYWAVSDALMKG